MANNNVGILSVFSRDSKSGLLELKQEVRSEGDWGEYVTGPAGGYFADSQTMLLPAWYRIGVWNKTQGALEPIGDVDIPGWVNSLHKVPQSEHLFFTLSGSDTGALGAIRFESAESFLCLFCAF
ncbi:MAG: hypothetical protein MK135_11140 [Polyangiaceae bacterium]|nr:hypothetical protein [Polyangiaceae bacterium]